MKKTAFFIFLLFAFSTIAFCQLPDTIKREEEKPDERYCRLFLLTKPGIWFINEFPLYAEYKINRMHTVGISAGYVHPGPFYDNDNGSGVYSNCYWGYAGRFYYKIFVWQKPKIFLSPLFLYKYLYYDEVEFKDHENDHISTYTRSEKTNTYSVQGHLGYEYVKNHFLLDVYCGLGYRWRERHIKEFDFCSDYPFNYCNTYSPPKEWVEYQDFAMIHLGIRLGIGMLKK